VTDDLRDVRAELEAERRRLFPVGSRWRSWDEFLDDFHGLRVWVEEALRSEWFPDLPFRYENGRWQPEHWLKVELGPSESEERLKDILGDRYINEPRELVVEYLYSHLPTPRTWPARLAGDRSRPEWRDEYAAYLDSPEWQAKRKRAMARARGQCEGCQAARAVEVHHLTYDHVGNEFLWELVAVCADCHQRVHGAPEAER
jgi:hypothetical protein